MPIPTIGRVVLYATDQRNGLVYDLPAIITVTRDSHPGDYPDGSPNPLPVPESDTHVHLTVLTPGGFGTKVGTGLPQSDAEFVGAPAITPGSGSYVEWNVGFDPDGSPRSWRWPTIVSASDDEALRAAPSVTAPVSPTYGNLGLPSVGP